MVYNRTIGIDKQSEERNKERKWAWFPLKIILINCAEDRNQDFLNEIAHQLTLSSRNNFKNQCKNILPIKIFADHKLEFWYTRCFTSHVHPTIFQELIWILWMDEMVKLKCLCVQNACRKNQPFNCRQPNKQHLLHLWNEPLQNIVLGVRKTYQ
jgi:hypothetical protein